MCVCVCVYIFTIYSESHIYIVGVCPTTLARVTYAFKSSIKAFVFPPSITHCT